MPRRTHPPLSPDRLIRLLYGSLSEELDFRNVLHHLGAAFRSNVSGIHTEDFGTHRGCVTLVGNLGTKDYVDFSEDYSNRWSGQNLWMERSLEGFREQGYQHGEAVVSDTELLASPYYVHALKRMDIRYGLAIQIWSDNKLSMAVASFHRGHRTRGFDSDDIRIAKQLRPHLVNAYSIYRKFAHLETTVSSLRSCLERATVGMLMLDADGCVLESNAAAEERLPLAGISRTRDGHLGFTNHRTQRRYADAVRILAGAEPVAPQSLRIEAPSSTGASPGDFVLHLCAVPSAGLSNSRVGARILAFIAELQPEQINVLAEGILRQALGLSPTESRVVLALRRRSDVTAVSKMLSLEPSTVRAHLRNIHSRLGINRTADLQLLAERLIGSAPRVV